MPDSEPLRHESLKGGETLVDSNLVGFVNVPIIKFSVEWWNTLHQPASVIRAGMPSIHLSMLIPLLLMAVGFTLFFVSLLLVRVKSEFLARRLRALRLSEIHRAQPSRAEAN